MEKYYVNTEDQCELISTSASKIDFLLNYSKSLLIIEYNGESQEHCRN